jgi:Fur family ferric uptake transcriptional regulator
MQSHDCKVELRQAGSKATPGRLSLLKLLEGAQEPLTAKQIEQKLHRLNPVTVYRALESLVMAGVVRRGVSGRVAHFEYAGKPHHHHFVCTDCSYEPTCRTC